MALVLTKLCLRHFNFETIKHIVTGIPMLVEKGKIVPNLELAASNSFVYSPHARTAIGVKADGTCVIVVVEHAYDQQLRNLTVEQVQTFLRKNNYSPKESSLLTMAEIQYLLEKHFCQEASVIGLSLPDLAK